MAGFAAISASTTAKVYFKLKALTAVTSSAIACDVFGVYEDNLTRVSLADVGTVSTVSSTAPSYLRKLETVTIPIFSTVHYNSYYMIEGTFNLRAQTLINGDYLYIYEPGWTAYGNRRFQIR